MLIGSKHNLSKYQDLSFILVNAEEIKLSTHLKDLGFTVDCSLTCSEQITKVVRQANYALRNIAHIKKYLDSNSVKKLVNNYIISRVDYCNSLYYNLPAYQLKKIQRVMNRAAKLTVGLPRRERITPVLFELHWLPIKARIIYKICVLTYIALTSGKPTYLADKLHRFETAGVLVRHSYDILRLAEPRANKHIGTRSFAHSAPRLFNSLPQELKKLNNLSKFKTKLKTYLFKKCYDSQGSTLSDDFRL